MPKFNSVKDCFESVVKKLNEVFYTAPESTREEQLILAAGYLFAAQTNFGLLSNEENGQLINLSH